MADAKTMSLEESRKEDKKHRRQDLIICGLGFALAILAKIIA
ncbi:hypothetical protein V6C27_01160 [Peptococcaceae bacterium 1198_IL3148]